MSELIDLDKVSVPDIRFKLAGHEYTVPGELDVETMLRWIRIQNGWLALSARSEAVRQAIEEGSALPDDLGKDIDSPEELLVESKNEVLALFRQRKPALKDLPLKSSQIGTVFAVLFGRYQDAEGGGDPTRPTPKRARKPKS